MCTFVKCKNISIDKKNNFEICPKDYLKAVNTGKILAYYHSHPDNNCDFSDMDKKVSAFNDLPLIMYCIKKDKFFKYGHG